MAEPTYEIHFDDPEPNFFSGTLEQLRTVVDLVLDELEDLAVDEEKQLEEGCLAKRVS